MRAGKIFITDLEELNLLEKVRLSSVVATSSASHRLKFILGQDD
jgi:hypothetical protein